MSAEKTLYEQLPLKRRKFVEAYLGVANGNKAEAARLAGYKGDAQEGYRLYRDPEVRAAIDELLALNTLSAPEILSRLSEQATASYADFIQDDGTVDLAGLRKVGLMRLVKKVSWDKAGNRTVEFHDPQHALELTGKHYRLFADKVEHSGPAGGPLVIREVTVHLSKEPADESEVAQEPLSD